MAGKGEWIVVSYNDSGKLKQEGKKQKFNGTVKRCNVLKREDL